VDETRFRCYFERRVTRGRFEIVHEPTMPKFSAHLTQLFTEVAFPQRFAAAARAGFQACEFRTPYDYAPSEIAQWLADSGLTNILFNLPAGDWAAGERGIAALPGRETEFRESVDRALEYAEALRTPMLHVMAGAVRPGGSRQQYREVFVENLRYAARQVARSNRTLLIEAINPRDSPGYFLNTQAEAHAIREEVGVSSLLVQLDFYHAQVVEGDLATKVKQYLPHIGHIQIAGVPDRNEPDDGEVNYRYLLRLLDKLGYGGWIGCEYVPSGRTEDGLGWLGDWLKTAL
jgi:hydroxypyruvate isomerase